MQYAILTNPGHNRVYFDCAAELSLAELEVAGNAIEAGLAKSRIEELCGIPYIVFDTARELLPEDIRILSGLSFCYAIFRLEREKLCLYPVTKLEAGFFDSGVSMILKYTGKTNELFTRMMINLALYSGKHAGVERISLLDPVAGKGTTLFEGLRLGFDVTGIEVGSKAVQEACAFFKKYLEAEKYKHTASKEKKSGANKSYAAHIYTYEFAKTKEDFKDKSKTRTLAMAEGNSRYADQILRKNAYHLIVGDLPYGVAHGNVTNEKQSSLTRNPTELLHACLPAWRSVLTPGGAIALAWNTYVLPRDQMTAIMEEHGFSVLTGGAYDRLIHRVDRSILRDVVVALKD